MPATMNYKHNAKFGGLDTKLAKIHEEDKSKVGDFGIWASQAKKRRPCKVRVGVFSETLNKPIT